MAGPGDPRIRWVRYDPDQVVELRATMGYQMTIEFGEDERIENVSIGDSLGWQITPNRKATLLFVKPVARGARTNMTVITSSRRYMFELSSRRLPPGDRGDNVIYGLHFSYPVPVRLAEAAPPPPAPPQDVNHAYSYRGSGRDLPTRVFDDGRATYFTFADSSDYPAILALDGKKEVMVNSSMRDGFVVVDQLAPAFILRRGKDSTTIINQGWREPAPGPLSPVPYKRTRG
jgi:type IV secretion system protein VirB9